MLITPVLSTAKLENIIDISKKVYRQNCLIFNTFRICFPYLPRQQKLPSVIG